MPRMMEVLEFLDNSGMIIVKRVPEDGPAEIKWGAQLTIRESQEAVFFRDGKALDVFGPGRHVLQTQNIPGITKWVTSFGYGPESPFRSEVYFVGKQLFPNLKWGTREPILFRDSELKMIRLRAFGTFSIQVADSILFVNKVVGTMGLFATPMIDDYLRSIIIAKLTNFLGQELKTVFDMPASFDDLGLIVRTQLNTDFAGLGLIIHDFYINSISVPEDVQKMIDTRSGISAVGNLDDFMKYKVAMSLETAAGNQNSSAGSAVGMGAGLGMGFMMPQFIQQSMMSTLQNSGPQGKESPTDKLKKLKELLDLGAITQAEFEEKKKKLLGEI